MVRASGEATVSVKPDRARITFGIVTQAPTAEAAAAQNAAQTTQMLTAIKHALGSGGEIRTSGYSVSPNYQSGKNGMPRKIAGYSSNNSLEVTIDDLQLVSKILDASAQAGANNINGVSFTVRDDQPARSRALAEAAAKARDSAEAIAKALNLRVLGVAAAETGDVANVRPQYRNAFIPSMAQTVEVSTPIEMGNIEVTATDIVTLEVQ